VVIILPLTHQEIANLAGLTRETTSVEMKRLENDGFIGHQKHLLVVNNLSELEEELEIRAAEESYPYVV
jgi:CRP-like cAMP-binding protein